VQTPDPQKLDGVLIRHDRQGRRARDVQATVVAPGRRERSEPDVRTQPNPHGRPSKERPTAPADRRGKSTLTARLNLDAAGTRQLTRLAPTLSTPTHLQQSCPCLHVDR
jgi:hypothetical protein